MMSLEEQIQNQSKDHADILKTVQLPAFDVQKKSTLLQKTDLVIFTVIMCILALAAFIQMRLILNLEMTASMFIMPGVIGCLGAITVIWLRVVLRQLSKESEHHLFARDQVTYLNNRLRELLETRTELLKDAQEQVVLAQTRSDLGALSAGVIHDLNNMLMVIEGGWRLFQDELLNRQGELIDWEQDELSELSKEIDEGFSQACNLSLSFQELIRPASRQRQVNINLLLDRLIPFLRRSMGVKQSLVFNVAAEEIITKDHIFSVAISEAELTQLIMNLVVNARDALQGAAGTVSVQVSSSSTSIIFKVSDTGIGISPEIQQQIFEPFFTTKPIGEGTGLGLHVLTEVVQRANGQIQLESTVGGGSVFTISLPKISLNTLNNRT